MHFDAWLYLSVYLYILSSINVLHTLSNLIIFMHLCKLVAYFHLCMELRLLIHTILVLSYKQHIYIFCICEQFVFVFVFTYREGLLHLGSVIHKGERHLFEVGAEEMTVLFKQQNKGMNQNRGNETKNLSSVFSNKQTKNELISFVGL